MKTSAAIKWFGSKAAIARRLGISSAAVTQWSDIVPLESAMSLEILTRGALRLDRSMYPGLARALTSLDTDDAAA